jgi:hypothetical protein
VSERTQDNLSDRPPVALTVVIPVLNEAAAIEACLAALTPLRRRQQRRHRPPGETLVRSRHPVRQGSRRTDERRR